MAETIKSQLEIRDKQIKLFQLDQGSIRVAQNLTELPPLDLLQQKLREARQIAEQRFIAEEKEN